MTRQSAIEILQAGLGQMISVYRDKTQLGPMFRLCRLIPDGPMNYREELVIERPSWHELVKEIFPDYEAYYDVRFDIAEQSYLHRLRDERKARRAKQKDSGSTVLQSDLQSRIEDNGISESNCINP